MLFSFLFSHLYFDPLLTWRWLSVGVKGTVHLIFKLHLKAVFLSMTYNEPISFGKNVCFLTQSVFKTKKNKCEKPKIMPDNPKNVV